MPKNDRKVDVKETRRGHASRTRCVCQVRAETCTKKARKKLIVDGNEARLYVLKQNGNDCTKLELESGAVGPWARGPAS